MHGKSHTVGIYSWSHKDGKDCKEGQGKGGREGEDGLEKAGWGRRVKKDGLEKMG